MKHSRNNKGLSLLEIVVAMGLLSFLATGSMKLIKNLGHTKSAQNAALDKHTILLGIHNILSTRRHCKASLGNPARPIEFVENQPQPLELFFSDQEGNPRGEAKYAEGKKVGKYTLTSVTISPSENFQAQEGTHYDEAIVEVIAKQEGNNENSKHPFRKTFRIPATFVTDASGLTVVRNCFHYDDNDDDDSDSQNLNGEYYFAGMFTGNIDPENTQGPHLKNPITNDFTCPRGFRAIPISMLDFNSLHNGHVPRKSFTYACLRKKLGSALPAPDHYYAFGGLFKRGPANRSKNPYTNDYSCPVGFTEGNMGNGHAAYRYIFCYKTLAADERPNEENSKSLGGFYSLAFDYRMTAGAPYAHYELNGYNIANIETKMIICPEGFQAKKISAFGPAHLNFQFYWCYSPL